MRDLHNAYVVAKYELWPSMLWKKLAMVKDYGIVQIVNLGGTHRQGEVWKGDVIFCVRVLYNAYVVVKYELWPSILWKKLAMVKDCVIVQIVNWGKGVHIDRGSYGKGMLNCCETFTMPMLWQNMNCGQVCYGKSWQWSKTM